MKYFYCRTSHDNVSIFELGIIKHTSADLYRDFLAARTIAIENGRYGTGTSSGATRYRLPGSALPDTHFQCMFIDHFDKLRIDAVRKKRMMFKSRSCFFQIKSINSRGKYDQLGFPQDKALQ